VPVVVDRVDEVDRLLALTRAALAGPGTAVFVEGEPGTGKSTMLDIVADECERLGARLLRGTADQLNQRRPFAAISLCLGSLLDPGPATLLDLMRAGLAGYTGHEFQVTEALADLVDHWCTDQPVALVLDDLHWADPASLLALHRLGAMLGHSRLLLAGTLLTAPRSGELAGLLRSMASRGGQVVTLGPLPDEAAVQLVERLVGAPAGPALRELTASAAGIPGYLVGLVAALSRDERITVVDGVADLGPAPAGSALGTLAATIGDRLDLLSRRTREALRVAALLGPAFTADELASVLGLPATEVWEVAAEGVRGGLLVEVQEQLRFRHDLVALALADELPVALRTAMDLHIGRALGEAGAPHRRVAERYLAASRLDGPAVDWVVGGTGALLTSAPDVGLKLVRHALAAIETGDRRTGALRCLLVRALLGVGKPAQAREEANGALPLVRDPAESVRLRTLVAVCQAGLGDLTGTEAIGQELIGDGSDPVAVTAGRTIVAATLLARRRVGAALAASGDTALVRGMCLTELDRYAEAESAYGQAPDTPWRSFARAELRFRTGRWDEALAEVHAGLDAPDHLGAGGALYGLAALIAVHRGDQETYRDHLDEPREDLPGPYRGWARAVAREAGGQPDEALDLLLSLQTPTPVAAVHLAGVDIARLAWSRRRRAVLRGLLDPVDELSRHCPAGSTRALGQLCRGLADADPDRVRLAAVAYREASRPWHAGQAWECAAAVYAWAGRPGPAGEALDRAVACYERLGAGWAVERARTAHGVPPRTGWAALTAAERRVVDRIVAGRTHPEIAAELALSRRAVQHHISSVLAKLGLASRVELIAAAYRRDHPTPE
jgi:DNA-binding CsgD family transcriptional regulator